MTKSKISKADMDDLKSVGYVEGQPNTIPENISPVLRDNLIQEWSEKNNVKDALELPTAVDTQNQLARERAAADEPDNKAAPDPLDHDGNGVKGGVKRQSDAATKN